MCATYFLRYQNKYILKVWNLFKIRWQKLRDFLNSKCYNVAFQLTSGCLNSYLALYSLVSFDISSFARRGHICRDRVNTFLLSLLLFTLPHKCSSCVFPLLLSKPYHYSSSPTTNAECTLHARSRNTCVHPSECSYLYTSPGYGPVPPHASSWGTSAADVLPISTTRRCPFPISTPTNTALPSRP